MIGGAQFNYFAMSVSAITHQTIPTVLMRQVSLVFGCLSPIRIWATAVAAQLIYCKALLVFAPASSQLAVTRRATPSGTIKLILFSIWKKQSQAERDIYSRAIHIKCLLICCLQSCCCHRRWPSPGIDSPSGWNLHILKFLPERSMLRWKWI